MQEMQNFSGEGHSLLPTPHPPWRLDINPSHSEILPTLLVTTTNKLTLYGYIKPQSSGALYSNTVIGTLAVDLAMGCYIWYCEEGPGRARRVLRGLGSRPVPSSRCNSPPINGQCTSFILFDMAL